MSMSGKMHSLETRAKMSEARLRTPHPISEETKKKISEAKRGKKLSSEHIAKILASRTPEVFRKVSAAKSRENNPNWKGGKSFFPYCEKFNDDLRRRVRAFHGYVCFTCGKTKEENRNRALSVHHVTYDKWACCNGKDAKFVPLCIKHHGVVNADPERWEAMFCIAIDYLYDGKSYYKKGEIPSPNYQCVGPNEECHNKNCRGGPCPEI